jgi:hypothetical protein
MRPGVAVQRFLPVRFSLAFSIPRYGNAQRSRRFNEPERRREQPLRPKNDSERCDDLERYLAAALMPASTEPRNGTPAFWGESRGPERAIEDGGIRSPMLLEQQAETDSSRLRDLRTQGSSTTPTRDMPGPRGSGLAFANATWGTPELWAVFSEARQPHEWRL